MTNAGFPFNWDHSHDGEDLDQAFQLGRASLAFEEKFLGPARFSAGGKGVGPWFVGGPHAPLAPGERMAQAGDPQAYAFTPAGLAMSCYQDPKGQRYSAHIEAHDATGAHMAAFRDGYFEAEITPSQAKGVHMGVWLLGHDSGAGHPEFDLFEGYGPQDRFAHACTHFWKAGKSIRNSMLTPAPQIYDGKPHRFGAILTEEWLTITLDRKLVGQIKRLPEQRVPLYPLISVFSQGPAVAWEPATMMVHGLRIWTR